MDGPNAIQVGHTGHLHGGTGNRIGVQCRHDCINARRLFRVVRIGMQNMLWCGNDGDWHDYQAYWRNLRCSIA